ncbi:MAG: hypothetical protein M0P29_14015 [Sphaerochaetaceae bacterium]|nr:hypothetical protein [Sphaerochaetaceae bacterium]
MNKGLFLFSVLLEVVGIIVVSAGITYEVIYKADVGYMIMSTGSLLIAAGGLVWGKVLKKK